MIGREDASPRALAILEIDPQSGQVQVDAYTASDFATVIDRTTLPESIGDGERRILRDDL